MSRDRDRICAAPGCDRVLDRRNRSGVCVAHNHLDGVCTCGRCGNPDLSASLAARPGIVVVRVDRVRACYSSADSQMMSISLPAPPWEVPA